MTINPTDFHETAAFLKDYPEEWHVRTSIGRSYYGLFLFLRDFLVDHGVELPDRAQHQFVFTCFHKSRFFGDIKGKGGAGTKKKKSKTKDKLIWGIAKRLKTLLQARREADYILHLKFTAKDSEHNLGLATSAVDDFEKLRGTDREEHIVKVALQQEKKFRFLLNRHTTP
jgi:hypothetical protein